MSPLIDEQTLARTYRHSSVADTYDIVTQYREATQYPDNIGSTRIARDMEVPRGRVRPWLDGSKPDAVTAIETSQKKGWLLNPWANPTPELAFLCMAIFACGSIKQDVYVPSWTPSTATNRDRIKTALSMVGTSHRATPKRETRSAEICPQSHASILGRAISVMGAPTGDKTAETVTRLPNWLFEAPEELRRQVAILFVSERGIKYSNKATRRIQTDRPLTYYQDLKDLIKGVTDKTVTVSESGVTISASTVRDLDIN